MNYLDIPSSYRIGGTDMTVQHVERCEDNALGNCCIAAGKIEIATFFNKDQVQSPGSKKNTFYHELTHSILETMGEGELSKNEKFVSTFSSFLCEAMDKAIFIEK